MCAVSEIIKAVHPSEILDDGNMMKEYIQEPSNTDTKTTYHICVAPKPAGESSCDDLCAALLLPSNQHPVNTKISKKKFECLKQIHNPYSFCQSFRSIVTRRTNSIDHDTTTTPSSTPGRSSNGGTVTPPSRNNNPIANHLNYSTTCTPDALLYGCYDPIQYGTEELYYDYPSCGLAHMDVEPTTHFMPPPPPRADTESILAMCGTINASETMHHMMHRWYAKLATVQHLFVGEELLMCPSPDVFEHTAGWCEAANGWWAMCFKEMQVKKCQPFTGSSRW